MLIARCGGVEYDVKQTAIVATWYVDDPPAPMACCSVGRDSMTRCVRPFLIPTPSASVVLAIISVT